mgnify:CR=1 FL=1
MKVTVIATGFQADHKSSRVPARAVTSTFEEEPGPVHDEPLPEPTVNAEVDEEGVPFYRKVIAQAQNDDPNGYGPNWSNVDDYDIPTVLRKQMD